MQDNFSIDGGEGGGGGLNSGGNVSNGEQQMRLCSLACCSPPTVWPGS